MPFGFLLQSGDNEDCGPVSVPEQRGERSSEAIVPSSFSISPKVKTNTWDTLEIIQ